MEARRSLSCSALIAAGLVFLSSCSVVSPKLVSKTISTGGEQRLKPTTPPPVESGPHVIIFALDGAVPDRLMQVIYSGKVPHMAQLLGKDKGDGLFEHAYAAPNALSVLPSSTIADWASTFTGDTPAWDGVTGDEWFDRETATFYAPVPISVPDIDDNTKVMTDDLVGHALKVPTLYELLGKRSYVSLLSVYRGATYYTTLPPSAFGDLLTALIKGALPGGDPYRSLSGALDRNSIPKITAAIEEHGVPDLQVVYFPGIDIFAHVAEHPLESQARYLELVTDPAVGEVLNEYLKKGVLDETYVVFIADHAQIPTINDERHRLGTDEESPFFAVAQAGFRVRRPILILGDTDKDYQAVLAYQGFIAYVYLADRSTCRKDGERCNWKKPPRFEEDVIPVLKNLYRSNRVGNPVAKLKGTIDLIFARQPVGPGEKALPYEIFDGHYLVSIHDYLIDHPRPDLVRLEERMRWLSAGPYGNRAGDILLLARACTNIPIQDRYYFSEVTHYTWHGSTCEQDSHIPFILAQYGGSGEKMRSILRRLGGDSPSERQLTTLVRTLLSDSPPALGRPAGGRSKSPMFQSR
jgi:hypothetical protein